MRGIDYQQGGMFSYLSPETRVRKDHEDLMAEPWKNPYSLSCHATHAGGRTLFLTGGSIEFERAGLAS